jgi:hypothetical protein
MVILHTILIPILLWQSGLGSVGCRLCTRYLIPLSESENTEPVLDTQFERVWEALREWNEGHVEAMME